MGRSVARRSTRRRPPPPGFFVVLGAAFALVGGLATDTVHVSWPWWPAMVWTAVIILLVVSVVLEVSRHRSIGGQDQPADAPEAKTKTKTTTGPDQPERKKKSTKAAKQKDSYVDDSRVTAPLKTRSRMYRLVLLVSTGLALIVSTVAVVLQPWPLGYLSAGEEGAMQSTAPTTSKAHSPSPTVSPGPVLVATLADHKASVRAVAFSKNLMATASTDRTVRIWDVTTPSSPRRITVLTGHTDEVYTAAFHPSGKLLATGSKDKTVLLWDVTNPASPRQISIITSHTRTVRSVAFSPAGSLLATGGEDRSVLLWDVTNPSDPQRIATISDHTGYVSTGCSVIDIPMSDSSQMPWRPRGVGQACWRRSRPYLCGDLCCCRMGRDGGLDVARHCGEDSDGFLVLIWG
jgi:hypothetical protein